MKKRVLIAYRLNHEGLEELLQQPDKYDVTMPHERSIFSREETMAMLPDYHVLMPNFTYRTDSEMIDCGTNLELISNYAAGFDNIDIDYASKKGITVTNTPNSVLEPTAEFAFGLMINAGRRIGFYDSQIRKPQGITWSLESEQGMPMFGRTLGIIGMGRIGQAVARRAVASGMSIVYHNRNRLHQSIEQKYNARYTDLNELLKTSDYISLNAPASAETHHLIGEAQIAMMKPTAVFVNTARGSLVDEKALAKALAERRIFAAGIDVFENEPNVTPSLLTLDNVVLAPHAATRTHEARTEMAREMARNIIGFYDKSHEISIVNQLPK